MPKHETLEQKPATPRLVRLYVAITLSAAVVWQALTSLTAYVQGAIYLGMFKDMGYELPGITKLLIQTYKYFWIAPIIGAVLTVDLIRRRTIRPLHASLVLILLLVVGFTLRYIFSEGVSAPMMKTLEAVRSFHD